MSFKMEVATYHNGAESWTSNSCCYATREEADAAGEELLGRWTVPHAHRSVESNEPVNYRFDFDQYRPVRIESVARQVVNQLLESRYEVIVGNVGTVYGGHSLEDALASYNEYADQSRTDYGRASGEEVTLVCDGNVMKQFDGDPA